MHKLISLALALALFSPAAASAAEERATTKDAELMVHNAVAFLKKEGQTKAFAAFNDPKGAFTYRDLYIMVFDLNGKCLAHGAQKDRIGKNQFDSRDADGKYHIRERIKIAKEQGKGWQDYKWPNPAKNMAIETKAVYFELVDGVIVSSGAYKS